MSRPNTPTTADATTRSARLSKWLIILASFGLFAAVSYRLGVERARIERDSITVIDARVNPYPTASDGFFPVSFLPFRDFDDARQLKNWTLRIGGDDPVPALRQTIRKLGIPPSLSGKTVSPDKDGVALLPIQLPEPTTLAVRSNRNLAGGLLGTKRFISYRIYLPPDAPGWTGCLFYVTDKDGNWFEARSKRRLLPGRWNTLTADLSDRSPDMQPLGHTMRWSEQHARHAVEVGFKIFGDVPYEGRAAIDDIYGWTTADGFNADALRREPTAAAPDPDRIAKIETYAEKAGRRLENPLTVSSVIPPPARCERFERVELSFRIDGPDGTTFDPDELLVIGRLDIATTRVGESNSVQVQGFLNREHQLSQRFGKDSWAPKGDAFHTLRFRPQRDGDGTLRAMVVRPARLRAAISETVQLSITGVPPESMTRIADAIAYEWIRYTGLSRDSYFGLLVCPDINALTPGYATAVWSAIERLTGLAETSRVRLAPEVSSITAAIIRDLCERQDLFIALAPFKIRVEPSDHRGFLRVSKTDTRFFEFDNGEFFYPIGHNLRSPNDPRCAMTLDMRVPRDRGMFAYDKYLKAMSESGETFAEIWMSSWFLGIEWTERWPGYFGVGDYNLENAWKLDQLLEMCDSYGIMVHLVIDNHGKLSSWCDPEWNFSPYPEAFSANGRPINSSEFFAREDTRAAYKKKLDYIVARFSDHPRIAAIELVSEFDLVGDDGSRRWYKTGVPRDWLREMLTHIKARDPYKHPVTVHYATDATIVDWETVKNDFVDYVVGDQYWGGQQRKQPGKSSFMNPAIYQWRKAVLENTPNKPYLITEFGGNWDGAPFEVLEADLHCGLWTSWFIDMAGTPLFWWYDMIHEYNLYHHFTAFKQYVKGEDKRGRNLKPLRWLTQVTSLPDIDKKESEQTTGLRVIANADGQYVWLWVFDFIAMEGYPVRPSLKGVIDAGDAKRGFDLVVEGLPKGKYVIEWWGCYIGGRVDLSEFEILEDRVETRVAIPPFRFDIAGKIRPADEF